MRIMQTHLCDMKEVWQLCCALSSLFTVRISKKFEHKVWNRKMVKSGKIEKRSQMTQPVVSRVSAPEAVIVGLGTEIEHEEYVISCH